MPVGQKMLIENICNRISSTNAVAICIVFEHHTGVDDIVETASQEVRRIYFNNKWHEVYDISVIDYISKFENYLIDLGVKI